MIPLHIGLSAWETQWQNIYNHQIPTYYHELRVLLRSEMHCLNLTLHEYSYHLGGHRLNKAAVICTWREQSPCAGTSMVAWVIQGSGFLVWCSCVPEATARALSAAHEPPSNVTEWVPLGGRSRAPPREAQPVHYEDRQMLGKWSEEQGEGHFLLSVTKADHSHMQWWSLARKNFRIFRNHILLGIISYFTKALCFLKNVLKVLNENDSLE